MIFRTDASTEIGTGHVMRCLVLANDLRKFGAKVAFICRKLPGNFFSKITEAGFPVFEVGDDKHAAETRQLLQSCEKTDWLIVDHYELDYLWEEEVKPFVKNMMVIDDLANRRHDCDVLLDQNHVANRMNRYDQLVPEDAVQLLGVQYLLLRNEFRQTAPIVKQNQSVRNVLISFGGSDPTNETMKALTAAASIPDIKVDVVIGKANPHVREVKAFCHYKPFFHLHHNIDYVAELMAKADIAIGAGGTTTWERIYMLLPTLTVETAANQAEILAMVAKEGLVCHLGKSEQVTAETISDQLLTFISEPCRLTEIRKKAASFRKQMDPLAVARFIMKGGE
ncbi:UDP-2,4-diacetamido-2,4,6-trideoxy-beta-L-altropyranose hydrolase [Gracilibacillus ureilyticus]|uniref:UDP-2,4-diacetamido-2,4,6-trideoxy-beta-L-altropyranose hydrolase n=1 Tax=Gracilibacillus ureilyticus TaxID=531814 RepID=A0A1H9RUH9_9BACI|nr:UDP-2,4-diacetamido-2,4,6-trideoxy-beta-L-altropyranose hydrolase [Gracilibacillus ureilyticus]